MKSHTISVTVGKDSIQVVPDTLVMTSDDDVQWAGDTSRKFSIEFDGTGPFEHRQMSHALATSKRRPRTKGHFKYTVVAEDDPGLVLDPVIIVEEPPTGRG